MSKSSEWRAKSPLCSIDGCDHHQITLKSGLCNMHYLRLQRYGSTEYRPRRLTQPSKNRRWFNPDGTRQICTIDHCNKVVKSLGYCDGHYHRLIRYGNPLFDPLAAKKRPCAMGKCDRLTTASHQFCTLHARSLYAAREKGTVPRIAREAVGNALKYGKLVKRPCEECGSQRRVEAHHEDYEKPLEVIWLCKHHHSLLHWAKRKLSTNGC